MYTHGYERQQFIERHKRYGKDDKYTIDPIVIGDFWHFPTGARLNRDSREGGEEPPREPVLLWRAKRLFWNTLRERTVQRLNDIRHCVRRAADLCAQAGRREVVIDGISLKRDVVEEAKELVSVLGRCDDRLAELQAELEPFERPNPHAVALIDPGRELEEKLDEVCQRVPSTDNEPVDSREQARRERRAWARKMQAQGATATG